MPANVSVAEMNKAFWEIRSRIQRIENTSDNDDDLWSDHISALLKYHTVNFIPYLQKFLKKGGNQFNSIVIDDLDQLIQENALLDYYRPLIEWLEQNI
ncbi:hypothetical protein QR98_0005140 [Sarcoptes scabiei]|uniref:Uncharacterized protein n=1 Tax=Sarcoptes scabiei TaxID=52283 RepID=A0A131ZTJ3_SARSC|nr:hypothetical protein QR98_0005140 [Sarcoptes scabiei]